MPRTLEVGSSYTAAGQGSIPLVGHQIGVVRMG